MMQPKPKYQSRLSFTSVALIRRRVVSAAVFFIPILYATHAAACTSINASDSADDSLIVNNRQQAGAPLTRWMDTGSSAGFLGCASYISQPLVFRPSMSGLRFVRDITVGNRTFPAYEWSSTSPLIIMQIFSWPVGAGGTDGLPVRADQDVAGNTEPQFGTTAHARLRYMLLSRGPGMSRPPVLTIGGTTDNSRYGSLGKIQHSITLQVDVQQLTCTLSDASIVLDDVTGADLPAEGATTGLKALRPEINCPAYGPDVQLTLRDAGDSSNTGNLLTPAGGSTATGVQVEILREGKPVQFGQAWAFPVRATGGRQTINLQARYARTGSPLSPGIISGKAIITATYN